METTATEPTTRAKSTHRVEIVPVTLEPHPNADSLSLVKVFGYQVVVRTQDWRGVDRGAYVVPDSVVDTSRPEFAFLSGHPRIKVKKLRGVVSQGLLVPAPAGAQLGDNVAELLGVTRYEPPEPLSTGGGNERGPDGWVPIYDVESWHRYKHLLVEDEPVVVTEKIHGASARYRWHNGRMYCGSRTCWKKQDAKNLWWKAMLSTSGLEEFCQAHPDWTVYGEVYGQVQDLKYGAGKNDVWFAAFDIWNGCRWLNWDEIQPHRFANGGLLRWVPVVDSGPYSENNLRAQAELDSIEARFNDATQPREGVVIRPVVERTDLEIGRVQLKLVSNRYLERA